jgi:hypothetical protein
MFELIKKIIFDQGITGFVTIVRTKFENFNDPKKCEEETRNLRNRGDAIGQMAKYCNGVIYVNNPTIDIDIEEGFNEKLKKKQKKRFRSAFGKKGRFARNIVRILRKKLSRFLLPRLLAKDKT